MIVSPNITHLSGFISIIIQHYFTTKTCFWFSTESNQNNEFINNLNKHSDFYVINLNKSFVSFINNENDLSQQIDKYYCKNFVVQSDYPLKCFETIENILSKAPNTKYYNRKYLFFPSLDGFKENLLESKLILKLFNILLINITINDDYADNNVKNLKVIKPMVNIEYCNYNQSKNCNQSQVYEKLIFNFNFTDWSTFYKKMTIFNENLTLISDLYEHHLQHGLVFNYATFTYGIYVDLEKQKGIELNVILEFCARHHFVCNLLQSHEKWGEVFGNTSDRGPLKWIVDGDADIALGGFYLQGRKLNFVDFVGPTGRLGLTCLVPQPKPSINMYTVVESFSLQVWISIIVSIIVFSLFTKCLLYGQRANINDCTFFILAIILQQSIIQVFDRYKKLRLTLIIFILFALVIAAAYTSQLYSALNNTKFDRIKTLDDLQNSKYNWGASHISYVESLTNTANYKYKDMLSRFVAIEDENTLIDRFLKGKFGLLTEKLAFGYIINPNITNDDLVRFTTMTEDLFWVFTAFMVHKHSVFHESLQKHILNVREGGLHIYWEHQILREGDYKAQLVLQFSPEHSYRALTMPHVQGIFIAWIIGIIIASCQFVYEKICVRAEKLEIKKKYFENSNGLKKCVLLNNRC